MAVPAPVCAADIVTASPPGPSWDAALIVAAWFAAAAAAVDATVPDGPGLIRSTSVSGTTAALGAFAAASDDNFPAVDEPSACCRVQQGPGEMPAGLDYCTW